MIARIFSRDLGSFVTIGMLLLCSAMAAAQETPPLPAVDSPPVMFATESPTIVATAPCPTVTRAPATIAWLRKESTVVVSIKDGSQVRGTLDGLSVVEISTDLGDLSLPSKMIERIKLNQDVNLSTIEYKGDRLTGVIELPTLRMRTTWGDVSIREDQLKRFPPGATTIGTLDSYATSPAYGPVTILPSIPPPGASAVPYPAASVAPTPTAPREPEKYRVQLEDKSVLVGQLRRSEEIRIKLAFAEIEVPGKSLSWLKRSQEDGSVKVGLANGDRVSGVLLIDEWTVESVLGTIRLDAAKVTAIRRGSGRFHWITRPVTEVRSDGVATMRFVRERVELFDDGPAATHGIYDSPTAPYAPPASAVPPPVLEPIPR